MSTGTVHGRDRSESSFMLRCLNTQFIRPWLAESMAFWNTVITVSGKLATSASCNNKYNQILLLCRNNSCNYKQTDNARFETCAWQITSIKLMFVLIFSIKLGTQSWWSHISKQIFKIRWFKKWNISGLLPQYNKLSVKHNLKKNKNNLDISFNDYCHFLV